MIANAFLTFYRVTTRHPLYALLNLLGLSFGVAVFVTLSLFVRFETSYEAWVPGADMIYQVGTQWTLPGREQLLSESSMGGLLEELQEDYPDLVGTRVWPQSGTIHLGAEVFPGAEQLVDPDFFKVFNLDLVDGDKATALSGPDKILLTAEMAAKYFPGGHAVGNTLTVSDLEGTKTYIVSGVLANLPRNSDLKFDFVRLLTAQSHASNPFWRRWGSSNLFTYLRIDSADAAKKLEAGFDDFVDRKAGELRGQKWHVQETLRLIPLLDAHLRDPQSKTAVITLGLVGLLAFGIAAINFINLATARAGLRAREVAVRKTLGATQGALRLQFLSEALAMTLLATIAGLSLVELALPLINAEGGLTLALNYREDWAFIGLMIAAVLAMGLASGLYPAFVLAQFKPAQVLASSRSPSGGRFGMRVREFLVVVQFAVVIAFFIMTIGFVRQLDHMKIADLGFRRDGLLLTTSTNYDAVTPAMMHSIWAAWRAVPGVTSVTSSNVAPGNDDVSNGQNVSLPGSTATPTTLQYDEVTQDFFKTYGARLLAGRFIDPSYGTDAVRNHELDRPDTQVNIVLNRRALKEFGFKSPEAAIGQLLVSGADGSPTQQHFTVVGVIDDLRFRSPKTENLAMFYYLKADPKDNQITAIRYEGVPEPVIRAALADAWRQVAASVPFELVSADDNLDKYEKPDRNRSNLFTLGAGIAGLVGCIGLYGMAAFTTSRRALEIAVRKVLGASKGAVIRLLVGQFLRPVLLANLIAWPVGYFVLQNWLLQFNDRISLGITPFLAASSAAIVIAVVTVFVLALSAANSQPGRALRNE
jgi:putative ABC transport system permease protein